MIADFCCLCVDVEAHYNVYDYGNVFLTHVHRTRLNDSFHAGGTIESQLLQTSSGGNCPYRFYRYAGKINGFREDYFYPSNPDLWNLDGHGWEDALRDPNLTLSAVYNKVMEDTLSRIPTYNYYDNDMVIVPAYEVSPNVFQPVYLTVPLDSPLDFQNYFKLEYIGTDFIGLSGSDIDISVPPYEEYIEAVFDGCGKLIPDMVNFLHYHWMHINYKATFYQYIPSKKYSCCEIIEGV